MQDRENSSLFIRDFTEGPLFGRIVIFSLPFMLSNALHVLYGLVDMLVVGHYCGSVGLSAVSVSGQISLFMTVLCLGVSTGGQVCIAQQIGSGKGELNEIVGTLFSFIMAVSILVGGAGMIFCNELLMLLSTPADALKDARDYLLVCCAGMIFVYGYNAVAAVLRGMGDSKNPLFFVLIATLCNIILDIVFVGVFRLRGFGAGLATVIGQAVAFFYSIIYICIRKNSLGFDLKLRYFKVNWKILQTLLYIGIPFAVRFAAINISMMFVNSLVNTLGVAASALFGIGVRIDDFVSKVCQGIMQSGTTIVGQNFAAGKTNRVKVTVYSAWILSFCLYSLYGVLLLFYSRRIYGWFTDDENVLNLVPVFVSAIVLHYPAMIIMRGTNALIMGIGNAWLGLCFAVFDGFFLRILL